MKFSFFKSLYQPLPIDDEDIQEEPQLPKESKSVADPVVEPLAESVPSQQSDPLADNAIPSALLDKIILLINTNFPESIRGYIDVERQKEQLYNQVKAPLNLYLDQTIQKLRREEALQQEQYQVQLRAVFEKSNKRISELEKERDEIQKLQLSTERQKRTLSDRVHELEEKLSLLDADRNRIDETRRQINEQLRKANIRLEQLEAGSENYTLLQTQLTEAQQLIAILVQSEEKSKNLAESAENATKQRDAEFLQTLTALQQRVADLENQQADYQQAEKEIKERRAELEQALIDASMEHDALIQRYNALELTCREQEAVAQKLTSLQSENKQLKDQMQDLLTHLNNLSLENEQLEERLAKEAEKRHLLEEAVKQPVVEAPQDKDEPSDLVSFEADSGEGVEEDEDALDWLIPTRLETPQEREARYEVERRQKEEQEQREREQQEREREQLRRHDSGQMSLW